MGVEGFTYDGGPARTLVLDGERPADWWRRQNASVEYYREAHDHHHIDPAELPVYKVFGAYAMAAALMSGAEHPTILDVGCGVFSKPSPAFDQLPPRCRYVGLDPLRENLDRSYSFICGRLEDLAERREFAGAFHVFAFGTSLDHLENLDTAARAVKTLAAPGARAVFWNGLSDPDLVAQSNGAAVFARLARYRIRAFAGAAYAGYGAMRLPRLLRAAKRQRDNLRHRKPLDDSHYRWFTEANSSLYLSRFGEVEELTTLPNTHHSIGVVRIR